MRIKPEYEHATYYRESNLCLGVSPLGQGSPALGPRVWLEATLLRRDWNITFDTQRYDRDTRSYRQSQLSEICVWHMLRLLVLLMVYRQVIMMHLAPIQSNCGSRTRRDWNQRESDAETGNGDTRHGETAASAV